MSRKHNTKHHRSKSNYPQRLRARGMTSAAVRMDDLRTLRKRAGLVSDETKVAELHYARDDV